jgi:hypothetical protein
MAPRGRFDVRTGGGPGDADAAGDRPRAPSTTGGAAHRRHGLSGRVPRDFPALGGMRTSPAVWPKMPTSTGGCVGPGGTVVLDPAIRSSYRPRETWRAPWRQFFRYGKGKADMLWSTGCGRRGGRSLLSPWSGDRRRAGPRDQRPVVAAGGLSRRGWAVLVAGGGRPLDALVAATMHLAYGVGTPHRPLPFAVQGAGSGGVALEP